MMKSKLSYLQDYKYGIESRLDTEVKPMTEEQMKGYTQVFTHMAQQCRKVVIDVEGDKHGESKQWTVGANDDQLPPINKLAGFRKAKDQMHPYYQQLYMEGIMKNDKSKQAEFISQYSKDLFWVLQSYLGSRIKPT